MQVIILCGGKGSRLRSENDTLPKPLALVNGKPLIWHIINIYRNFGYKEFILPLGYGGDMIKEYFYNYEWKNSDFTLDYSKGERKLHKNFEDWKVTLVDTGINTMTGARIKKIEKYITQDDFMLTYGDGLSDININSLVKYHKEKGRIATVTGILKNSQYGVMEIKQGIATNFREKSSAIGIINGGFFVLNRKVFNYLKDEDSCIFEEEPLNTLASLGELAVYEHHGFWLAVDTYKDLLEANKSWGGNKLL
ncbi:glucose-1-phosphate cytidylyltransferase [Clostridium amylolyticum]|uniref:Glucose-1-phosphate cytidylyltransferase n=1 Tax=Clostridium amylolyticum TaxID=1121298 RepID=A0A1M6PGZ0_9CLOT|nr:sugar phosphate nucleotidyltransferase [Clostridium amylolyticum]SHK07211.1 glucose-1-phosphate cytidylyltransferase [Clostridium amylolyticum]